MKKTLAVWLAGFLLVLMSMTGALAASYYTTFPPGVGNFTFDDASDSVSHTFSGTGRSAPDHPRCPNFSSSFSTYFFPFPANWCSSENTNFLIQAVSPAAAATYRGESAPGTDRSDGSHNRVDDRVEKIQE